MTDPANAASREAREAHARNVLADHIRGEQCQDASGLYTRADQCVAAMLALADEAASQPREVRAGGKLGWDADGMCDDHYRFACPKCALDTAPTDQAQRCGEVEMLMEALKPFAALADQVDDAVMKTMGVGLIGLLGDTTLPVGGSAIRERCTITLDALSTARFARAAFAQSGKGVE